MKKIKLSNYIDLCSWEKLHEKEICQDDWTIFHADKGSLNEVIEVDKKLSSKYILQVQFFIECKNIQLTHDDQEDHDLIKETRMTGDPEFDNLFKNNYNLYFLDHWRNYLGIEKMDMYDPDPFLSIKGSNISTIRNRNNNLLSISAFFPYNNFLSQDVRLIGWVWINENLDWPTRKNVHSVFIESLKSSEHKYFQAGILSKNHRSLNFFTKIGFEPLCIYLRPL
ncbi:MAG: hypothetical protein ISR65_17560 [Bacteriovoracaceae bacterium]|nr:hypothetical protein [Bacteriovoracaceae bacterium]